MPRTLFTFDTTHHALWAEEVVIAGCIPCDVVPAPPAAAARCNLAIEVPSDQIGRASEALHEAGVPFAIYREGID